MSKQAMMKALDALENEAKLRVIESAPIPQMTEDAIAELRAAIDAPEVEPFVWINPRRRDQISDLAIPNWTALFTTPPDTEGLRNELERIGAQNAKLYDDFNKSQLDLERVKADAERYRAIRNGLEVDPDNSGIVVSLIDDFGGSTLRGDAADQAIDAAIAAQGGAS